MKLQFFSENEFESDGTVVFEKMSPDFLELLDKCREMVGQPFRLTSSWRSREKNLSVGGSPGSMHLFGRAVDIYCPDSSFRALVTKAALSLGLSVGIMDKAIHLDDRANQILFHYYAKYSRHEK